MMMTGRKRRETTTDSFFNITSRPTRRHVPLEIRKCQHSRSRRSALPLQPIHCRSQRLRRPTPQSRRPSRLRRPLHSPLCPPRFRLHGTSPPRPPASPSLRRAPVLTHRAHALVDAQWQTVQSRAAQRRRGSGENFYERGSREQRG